MVISISGLFAMISGSALGLTATARSRSSLDPGALALRAHVRARSVPPPNPRQFFELILPAHNPVDVLPHESPLRVPQTQAAFHPRAQRNGFRGRDVHLQSRSFALRYSKLIHSPNSTRPC